MRETHVGSWLSEPVLPPKSLRHCMDIRLCFLMLCKGHGIQTTRNTSAHAMKTVDLGAQDSAWALAWPETAGCERICLFDLQKIATCHCSHATRGCTITFRPQVDGNEGCNNNTRDKYVLLGILCLLEAG